PPLSFPTGRSSDLVYAHLRPCYRETKKKTPARELHLHEYPALARIPAEPPGTNRTLPGRVVATRLNCKLTNVIKHTHPKRSEPWALRLLHTSPKHTQTGKRLPKLLLWQSPPILSFL